MHYLLNLEWFKIYIKIHTKYRSYMFRSSTVIRELVLNLAKVIFILEHSVKLRCYMLFGDVAACHRAECVLCAGRSAQHTTHTITLQRNFTECFNINITLARFSTSSLMMVV
jgi:hypothetical protein